MTNPERFKHTESSESDPESKNELTEEEAEDQLEELLQVPDNKFLREHEMNRAIIEDDSIPATEKLEWAKGRVRERLSATTQVNVYNEKGSENIQKISSNIEEVRDLIETLERSGKEIGRGGDSVVLVEDPDLRIVDPAVCYKIALDEAIKRGRNSIRVETELQGEFYELAQERSDKSIGVPLPLYEFEAGAVKLIAMEKLPALSVDDLLHGKGGLPEWFDVDEFCDALKDFIDDAHEKGLYHRDMHVGNIMVSQKKEYEEDERMGYVIDFGLSGRAHRSIDPYVKEVAGERFTYRDDRGIVEEVRTKLKELRKREQFIQHK